MEGYAAADFVGDARAVLDACGIGRASIVGHSMGGFHATAFAIAHAERTLSLVIVDAGPEAMPEGGARARRLSLERPESFADRAEAEAYLRRTSPGYDDSVYVWRSNSAALARIFAGSRDRSDAWARAGHIRCRR